MESIDRPDIDHAGEIIARTGSLEQFDETLRQEKQRFEIEIHDLVPAGLRKVRELPCPGGSGVVDQDIQPLFPPFQLGTETLDLLHVRKIRRKRMTLTRRRKLLRDRVASGGLSRRHVDLGSILDEASSDHFANPTS